MQRRLISLTILLLGTATAVFLFVDGLSVAFGDVAAPTAVTTVLYDGSLGNLPGDQSFTYGELPFPPFATQTISNGGVILDTTAHSSIQAGYGVSTTDSIVLNWHTGYKVTFQARVLAAASASNDRAGFSIIVLSDDLRGIELGFWSDQIFAQEDDSQNAALFTRAETAVFDSMAAPTLYELFMAGDSYILSSGGTVILNGSLRNYSNFEPGTNSSGSRTVGRGGDSAA